MLALLALVTQADAAAYYFLDSGTRAIGRGGAFIAGADDLSAQYYNPAALANVKRPMFNLNGWAVVQTVNFDRQDEEGLAAFEPVSNSAPPIYEPSGGYAANLGGIHPALANTTAAFGLYVPTAPYMAYPEDGAQRYSLVDSLIWQVYAGPSVAQRITPWLVIGAGLQYTFLRVEERLVVSLCTTEADCADGNDDPSKDIDIDIDTWDPAKFSGNFGVLIQPAPWLDIGASFQPSISYRAPGTMVARFNEDFPLADFLDGLEFTDDDVTVAVSVPNILRLGVQVRPNDRVRVEAAGTWTQWSSLTQLLVTDLDLTVKHAPANLLLQEDILVTEDIIFVTGYQDSWSARLGGDVVVGTPGAPVHGKVMAGLHYETSAVPLETQGVTLVDGNKWGVGLGGTIEVANRVAFDVTGAYQLLGDRTITDSQLRQKELFVDPADPAQSAVVDGKVVGNGQFDSNVVFVAVGATVYVGGGD